MVILAGDHIYKMDYELMLQQHVDQGADVTVGCLEVPRMEAVGFGVMHVDEKDMITAFVEKPADPPGIPGQPDMALASMGIYVFRTKFLADLLRRDAATPGSSRDFGKDLIPYIVQHGKAVAHRFGASCVRSSRGGVAYWRDVGTVDAYWEANIDLTDIIPELDLYDTAWPIWTYAEIKPPAKFVHDEDGRRGSAVSSLVAGDCIISGALDPPLAGLHRRARPLLRRPRRGGDPARRRHRPPRPAPARGRRPRRPHPRGPRGRRGRRPRRQALPPHRVRHLPHHPADDRRPEVMRPERSAAPARPGPMTEAPDAHPLRRLRGLPARQDRRPRRRRRRPAAGAGPPRHRGAHAPARLPRRDGASSARPGVLHDYPALLGVPARLIAASVDGLELIVIDSPPLYDRPGGPYGDPSGRDHPDNWRRFGALGRAAVDIAMGIVAEFLPDLVHAHDWQAGLAPAYLRFYGVPRPSVMTIHNIAFQGGFPPSRLPALELPPQAAGLDGVEFHGGVGYLKAGIANASAITTVSPTYAEEIKTPAYGMGLDGLISARAGALHGIVNGIDTDVWNPETDPLLAAPPTPPASSAVRAQNRAALAGRFGLHNDDTPLFVLVSRLTWQKGIDLLAWITAQDIVRAGHRLAVLGSGDAGLETPSARSPPSSPAASAPSSATTSRSPT